MSIKNNILSFIYDKDYCVCLFENRMFIYNYKNLINFSEDLFIININKKELNIYGSSLVIEKLTNKEILISGIIKKVEIEEKNENKSSN